MSPAQALVVLSRADRQRRDAALLQIDTLIAGIDDSFSGLKSEFARIYRAALKNEPVKPPDLKANRRAAAAAVKAAGRQR